MAWQGGIGLIWRIKMGHAVAARRRPSRSFTLLALGDRVAVGAQCGHLLGWDRD